MQNIWLLAVAGSMSVAACLVLEESCLAIINEAHMSYSWSGLGYDGDNKGAIWVVPVAYALMAFCVKSTNQWSEV